MDFIKQYLLSVVLSAIIVSIITSFSGKKYGSDGAVKLICSVYLLFVVAFPLTRFDHDLLEQYFNSFSVTDNQNTILGSELRKSAQEEIIKQKIASYILDKADQVGADLEVDVFLSDDTLLLPIGVQIRGVVSPGNKEKIQGIIAEDLGVARENQIWTQ